MKLFNLATLILILALFAMPAFAQDDSVPSELPEWAIGLPSVLTGLVLFNFKTTDVFKRMLANEKFGGSRLTPSKDVQSVIVLLFSLGVGISSAFFTPDATSWLPDAFHQYPYLGYVITGVSVSTVGGIVHQTLARLFPSTPVSEAKG